MTNVEDDDESISQADIDRVHVLCDLWHDWANAYGYLTAVATIAGQSYADGVLHDEEMGVTPDELMTFFRRAFDVGYRQAMQEKVS